MELQELVELIRNLPKIEKPKCLGEQVTKEQYDAIHTGTFEGNVGDYWIINGYKWEIYSKDIYYNDENNSSIISDIQHHIIISPERNNK